MSKLPKYIFHILESNDNINDNKNFTSLSLKQVPTVFVRTCWGKVVGFVSTVVTDENLHEIPCVAITDTPFKYWNKNDRNQVLVPHSCITILLEIGPRD